MILSGCFLLSAAEMPVPTFEQTLVIENQPPDGAPQILPVYAGKHWAFSARWDDNSKNSLNMHQAMAGLGLKGSFYLNTANLEEGFNADSFRQLCRNGCSVAGHTSHHYWLSTLNLNALFYEILDNRIELECETDRPVNSFAFPYGEYQSLQRPEVMKWITDAWLRSGYHHCVYSRFVKNNRFMLESYASTVNHVFPGDSKIDEERFRSLMEKTLSNPKRYQSTDYNISLGVHARQSAEELEKFKTLLAEYTGHDDFWYCNQTDFAAYRFQAKQTKIVPMKSLQGTYVVTRPCAGTAGSNIPLTLAIPKNSSHVLLDGQTLEMKPYDDQFSLVELPYPAAQTVPVKIDRTESSHPRSEEFPGLEFLLDARTDGGWALTLSNKGRSALSNLYITLRLPLCYENGLRTNRLDCLPAGRTEVRTYDAGNMQNRSVYTDGPLFAAAEIDFMQSGQHGRIYATYLDHAPEPPVNDVRDAAIIAGPLAPETVDWPQLLKLSVPGKKLTALSESPLGQWHQATEQMRRFFARDHIVPFVDNPEWIAAAQAFRKKSAALAVVFDFQLPESGSFNLQTGCQLVHAGLDGKNITLEIR